MQVATQFVREQGTDSVAGYRKRVHRLAATYAALVVTAVAANLLILFRGKLFVTLAQRSNVETLTLAVVLLLFTYLAVVSLPGAWGACKILFYNAPAWFGRERSAVEGRKQAALRPQRAEPSAVYLNCRVSQEGAPADPVWIPFDDAAGSLGKVRIDGARMEHVESLHAGSNGLLAYIEVRLQQLVRKRDPGSQVQIVQWGTIDDEGALQYGSLVEFSRNLERHLGCGPLWPTVEVTASDLQELKEEATQLCPILRDEAHLPDLEYQVEHRLPIIPEPLAFISLSRQEQRADPLASMGCALAVALVILGFLIVFILRPPWVPGK
jgi:hypothetical protein